MGPAVVGSARLSRTGLNGERIPLARRLRAVAEGEPARRSLGGGSMLSRSLRERLPQGRFVRELEDDEDSQESTPQQVLAPMAADSSFSRIDADRRSGPDAPGK